MYEYCAPPGQLFVRVNHERLFSALLQRVVFLVCSTAAGPIGLTQVPRLCGRVYTGMLCGRVCGGHFRKIGKIHIYIPLICFVHTEPSGYLVLFLDVGFDYLLET